MNQQITKLILKYYRIFAIDILNKKPRNYKINQGTANRPFGMTI
jgi:hypothetical protein